MKVLSAGDVDLPVRSVPRSPHLRGMCDREAETRHSLGSPCPPGCCLAGHRPPADPGASGLARPGPPSGRHLAAGTTAAISPGENYFFIPTKGAINSLRSGLAQPRGLARA